MSSGVRTAGWTLLTLGLAMGFVPGSQGKALFTNSRSEVGFDAQGNCCTTRTTWEPFGRWVMIDARLQFVALLVLTIVGTALLLWSHNRSSTESVVTRSPSSPAQPAQQASMVEGGWKSRPELIPPPPPFEPAPHGPGSPVALRLRELSQLHAEGLISESEFSALRAKALDEL